MRQPSNLRIYRKRYRVVSWIVYGDGSIWFSAANDTDKHFSKYVTGWL